MRLDGDTFFVPTHFYNVLGTRDSALRVSDGDAVVTSTLDDGGRNQANIERAPKPNPVTDPFFVEGVSPATRLLCRSTHDADAQHRLDVFVSGSERRRTGDPAASARAGTGRLGY